MAGGVRLLDVQWDSDGQRLVWLENRSGQGVLVGATPAHPDAPVDLTPPELSVRAQVGYGGGECTAANGLLFFVEKSGQLYRQPLIGGLPCALTPRFGHAAAPTVSPDGQWILFVHSYEETDVLAVVNAEGNQWPQRLIHGHDFYMQPRWHPDGRRLAYVAWNHPQMPWDGTRLYLATLRPHNGDLPLLDETRALAGSDTTAIFQPEFSPDGRWLAYISDTSGWGQIYLYDLQHNSHHQLTTAEAEHGQPAWLQGMRTYGWFPNSRALWFIRNQGGIQRLYQQAIDQPQATPLAGLEPYTALSQPAIAPHTGTLALVGSSSTQPPRLLTLQPFDPAPAARILRRTQAEVVPPAALSPAQPVTWHLPDDTPVHGMLYLPPGTTQDDLAAASTAPPAIIRIHGGPTSQATASYAADIQFFTTRGYVVLLVNYRGSTGYGRAYMEALRGNWGVCDVEDAISGASYLAAQKLADAGRIVLMGSSSGGYTVLETLCRTPGVFRAGVCLYGIANLFTLVADTHKFEARYLDSLVGPLPAASAIYRDRSPIFHAHLLKDPIAVFHGEDDKVVPRSQSDAIVAVLRRNGVPHEYYVFADEGHGWRRSETIERYYRALDRFLQQHVLFA